MSARVEEVDSMVHASEARSRISDTATTSKDRRGPSPRIALVLSIVAVGLAATASGLAAWAVLRPTSPTPTYSDAQRSDAKSTVCAAFETVRAGVVKNTNLVPPGGEADVVGAWAVAANARVSLYDGGQYLLARLDPATSPDLADAVRKFANTLMDIGATATTGVDNSDTAQAARLREAHAQNTAIDSLCK